MEAARNAEIIARRNAEKQTLLATQSAENARQQTNIAIEAREDANKLLLLTTAQTLALKSLQEVDNNLKGLMAQQAFVFNIHLFFDFSLIET